ncbi:MAG: ABC transporter permease [Chloroflexota bacterium]|nr:ABC transporter permease [Chloroflexota bacterium]
MALSNDAIAAPRSRARVRADQVVSTLSRVRELGLVFALLLIVVIVGLQQPRFVSPNNIRQILEAVSILGVLAVGQTLVVLTRNVDLSVASIVGLVAYVAGDLFKQNPGINVGLVIGLVLLMGLGLGAINGLLVTYGQVPAIVATLGTLYVYRGIDYLIASGQQITVSDVPDAYRAIAGAELFAIPLPIVITAVIVLIATYVLRYTRFGRQLYAVGSNPEAARIVGLQRDQIVFAAFALSGLLAAVGGILWGAKFGAVDARAAYGYELQVVAAVVVGGVNIFGGVGTVIGAVLGAIVLGSIQNALTILRLNPFWLQAISGGVILLAVLIDALITRRLQRMLLARRQR